MTRHTKLLFLVIAVSIVVMGAFLVKQIYRSTTITTQVKTTPLVSEGFYTIPITADDPAFGNPGADLEIIAFLDIGETDSRKIYSALSAFVKKNPEKAHLVWKDFPTQSIFLGNNNNAHAAAWCAFKQQKFWPFVDAVTKPDANLRAAGLEATADELKLNKATWMRCLESPEAQDHLKTTVETAKALGLSKAPALFINSKRIAIEEINVEQMLESLIVE